MSLESRPALREGQRDRPDLLSLFLDSPTEILDSLPNITVLFQIPSKAIKDTVRLHKCLFHLIATLIVLDVPRVIFVPN